MTPLLILLGLAYEQFYRRIRLGTPAFRHGGASRLAQEDHGRTLGCRCVAGPADERSAAEVERDQQRARTTCTYQLLPTPAQQRAWARGVWRRRARYQAGLGGAQSRLGTAPRRGALGPTLGTP